LKLVEATGTKLKLHDRHPNIAPVKEHSGLLGGDGM